MAGVREDELKQVGPFPDGVNNVADLKAFPRDENGNLRAARELVNVDLDAAGRPRRKRGQSVLDDTPHHSLHNTGLHLLAMRGPDLVAYDDFGAGLELVATLIPGLGDRFVSYATDDFETYWSNDSRNGRLDADLQLAPFWIDTPAEPLLTADPNGGLAAGSYEVSLTVVDASGRESGASAPVLITLTTGQGIALALPAPPAGAVRWRVYRSTPDGEVLYRVADAPIAVTGILLGHTDTGAKLETAYLFPMPPCAVLRYGHGRLLGLAGNVLHWSEPYRLGLMHDENHLVLGNQGTLLEAVGEGGEGGGWFVADHKRTYWLAGSDPKQWRQVIRYPHAAVPGTSLTLPGTVFGLDIEEPVAFWLAANGVFCLGLPGGVVKPLRENELALPLDSERGAVGFFMFDGIRQIVTSVLAGAENPMGVRDSAALEVRRNGIPL